jgi:hypothetical protein
MRLRPRNTSCTEKGSRRNMEIPEVEWFERVGITIIIEKEKVII